MNEGKHELSKLTLNGQDYYLVVNKVIDTDPGQPAFAIYVTRGSWQVAQPEIIADPGYLLQKSSDPGSADPVQYLTKAVADMNNALQNYFGPAPVPVTWWEKIEEGITRLALFLQGNTVQVK